MSWKHLIVFEELASILYDMMSSKNISIISIQIYNTKFQSFSIWKEISASLWIMNNFPPYKPFPTGQTSQASSCSITISIKKVFRWTTHLTRTLSRTAGILFVFHWWHVTSTRAPSHELLLYGNVSQADALPDHYTLTLFKSRVNPHMPIDCFLFSNLLPLVALRPCTWWRKCVSNFFLILIIIPYEISTSNSFYSSGRNT